MYISDPVDSDIRLVKDDGATSTYKEFDPYGARDEKVTVVPRDVFDPFRYRFGLVDRGGTGRYLFGVRFYDPNQGVWTQQDSLDAPLDHNNANRYAYAGSDPVNNFDPLGLVMFNIGFEVCVFGCVSGEFGVNDQGEQMQWGVGLGPEIDGSVSIGLSDGDPVTSQEYDLNWGCSAALYGGIYVGGSVNDALFNGAPPVTSGGGLAGMGGGCNLSATTTLPL